MNPREENILNVLNLLTLLFNTQRKNHPELSEEERHTLTITKEHLDGANLTTPVFLNTLEILADKKYLTSVGIFEEQSHKDMRDFFDDGGDEKAIQELSKLGSFSTEELEKALKEITGTDIEFNKEDLDKLKVTPESLIRDAKGAFKNHKDTDIAVVLLLPFRDINRLLKRISTGKEFDDIQDSEFYYDPVKYEFHVGDDVISVSYQDKPNIEHDVLIRLRDELSDGIIGFEDVDVHKPRALKDALIKFVNKNKKLEGIFKIHSDRLEINKDYLN